MFIFWYEYCIFYGISVDIFGDHVVKELRKILAIILFLVLPVGMVQAVPVNLSFTAIFDAGAPESSVSGSIVYEAASLGATIDSLTSISLTIDGYVYDLGEVGYTSPWGGDLDIIGGTTSGINGMTAGTNDFWLVFNRNTETGIQFSYTTESSSSLHSFTFESFSMTSTSQVPEPGVLALLSLGLLIGFGYSRRKA